MPLPELCARNCGRWPGLSEASGGKRNVGHIRNGRTRQRKRGRREHGEDAVELEYENGFNLSDAPSLSLSLSTSLLTLSATSPELVCMKRLQLFPRSGVLGA